MPLYKTININKTTKVLIWKIQESFEELNFDVVLTPKNQARLDSMKSEIHQRGFLSVRHLLKEVGYIDADLVYDEFGKPHLKNGKFISITHSHIFSGIIISDVVPVGIDIEKQREKITKIAKKFTTPEDYKAIKNNYDLVKKLTVVWGAKESLYKIYGKKKIKFIEHIFITDFSASKHKTTGEIRYNNTVTSYDIPFLEFEGFTCVYAY